MAVKYHISENGMPGKCSAATPDSCPKTQAGDSFHGTLEEATQESQERFSKELGAFVTASKSEEAEAPKAKGYTAARFEGMSAAELRRERDAWDIENPADDPTDLEMAIVAAEEREAAQEELYVHRQGKIIRVNKDGSVEAFTADGKKASTSATAEKLREGYGAWKRAESGSANLPDAPKPQASPKQEDEMVEDFDRKTAAAKKEHEQSIKDWRALTQAQKIYDEANADREGRAYYFDNTQSFGKKIRGINPKGYTQFESSQEQRDATEAARARTARAAQAKADAQTELEEAGLGHRIPDEGHTIRVRTQAQKWLLKDELQGQISDGHWENSSSNPWQDWSNAKVVVDPKNPGRNFSTRKDNYQLNSSELLAIVGDRMVENVQTKTSTPDYDDKKMYQDLKDLRTIFKTKRDQVSGD